MICLPVEGLHSRGILHEGHNHISVPRGLALLDNDGVPVENAGVYHGISLHLQHKALLVRHKFHRNRKIGLYVFHSQNRLASGHLPDDGNIDDLPAGQIEIVVYNLNSPGLRRIPADIAVLLQRLQVRVNGRSRLQIHGFADIADRRGIALINDLGFYIFKNF